MKIIGFSGIAGAMAFKRAHWPNRDEREYRISQGHDSAAALIVDGEIVAAVAEERLSRRKHTGDFPVNAIRYCLNEGGIELRDVDQLVHAFDYAPYRPLFASDPLSSALFRDVFSREAILADVATHLPGFPAERVNHVAHHLAHAASAYYTSGWDECLVVVCDGMGEVHSLSIYHAREGKLNLISHVSASDSIGILYSLVTLHLGFDFNADEYKIMGLAPYGDPERFRGFFDAAVQLNSGSIQIPALRLNRTRDERELYLATRMHLSSELVPERQPAEEVTETHRDVAAALQDCLDRVLVRVCGHYGRALQLSRLALAGGVALNCTANGKLLRTGIFREVYVQPAAGDDGTALGAALHQAAQHGEVRNQRMRTPYLGPGHGQDAVRAAIERFADRIEVTPLGNLDGACEAAAHLIRDGRVIAWYQGRMEFGPRALGNRSILADPGHPAMRDKINAMVKMREAFRPFAPAVTLDEVDRWFEVLPGTELPYMIIIVNVRGEHRAALPAITHVDGSARVQTVRQSDNPVFYSLLKAVGRETGREMVLNTSFNVKGQPIVDTPSEAIETFLGTGIEFLFINDLLISKRD